MPDRPAAPLKAALALEGTTVGEFAAHLGYKRQTLARIARGAEHPWPKLHRAICDNLGYNPWELPGLVDTLRTETEATTSVSA